VLIALVQNSSITSRLAWTLSRAAGLTALAIMIVVVILGLLSAGRVWARLGHPEWKKRAIAWHRPLAWVGLCSVILHVGLLYFDPWLKPGLKGLLLPFTMHKLSSRWWVTLGWLALWTMGFVIASFYQRRKLKSVPGGWKALHRLGWITGVLIIVHALGSGTDLKSGWPRDIVLTFALGSTVLFLVRLIFWRGDSTQSPSRT